MRKRVEVYDPDTKQYRTYINDADGFSAKDAVITFGLGTFLILLIVGGIKELFLEDGITSNYIDLVRTAVPVISTAVGGIFGVQAVQSFRSKKEGEAYDKEI